MIFIKTKNCQNKTIFFVTHVLNFNVNTAARYTFVFFLKPAGCKIFTQSCVYTNSYNFHILPVWSISRAWVCSNTGTDTPTPGLLAPDVYTSHHKHTYHHCVISTFFGRIIWYRNCKALYYYLSWFLNTEF